jgi:heptosyltransferase-2
MRKRILIIAPSWIGDMVMAHSLIQILKTEEIGVLAPQWSAPLLERMDGVSSTIIHDFKHGALQFKSRFQIAQLLREKHYDQAILLPNSLKSALIPFLAKIPQRTGYLGEMRFGLLNDIRTKKHYRTVDQFVALGLSDQTTIEILPPYLNPQSIDLSKFNLNLEKPILALCAGAEYGSAKRWLIDYFVEVAQYYLKQNWQVWAFGSIKEQAQGFALEKVGGINLCGKTTLAEAIDLLSLSNAVISNDSGLMHVAAALNKPLIAIYGSSDPFFTPPLNTNAKVLSLGLSCSPCFKRECPLEHLNCLRDLKPKQVITTLNEILALKNNN